MTVSGFRFLLQAGVARQLQRNKPNILCLTRPQFDRDVKELQDSGTEFNYISFPYLKYFYPIRRTRAYGKLQQRTFFRGEDGTEQLFAELTREVHAALSPWIKRGEIVGVMSGNYDYYQDEPFLRTARAFSLPFFVLEKECGYSPQMVDVLRMELQQKPFPRRGHIGLLAGPGCKVHLEPNAGLDPESTFLTGLPRIDRIERMSRQAPRNGRGVLLFEFGDRDVHPKEEFDKTLISLAKTCEAIGFPLVIQSRDSNRRAIIRKRLGLLGLSKSKAIQLRTNNLDYSLATSRWVIGANTMGLYEALFSEATVISLASERFSVHDKSNIQSDSEGSMLSVADPEEITEVIKRQSRVPLGENWLSEQRVALRESAFTRPPKGSTSAVEQVVLREVGRFRDSAPEGQH